MDKAIEFVNEHRARFVRELTEWVKVPSVSADPKFAPEVRRGAEQLAGELRTLGLATEIFETPGHPTVYAEWMGAPGKPTVLIYGHHDVQPPDPLHEWKSPPFEPEVREGRLWGRGVVDDKGQVYIHVKAIEALLKTAGSLPCNVKLIVEGEEEVGSVHLGKVLEQHREKLRADFCVISDTAMFGRGIPSLCVGLRGLAYCEVEVSGPRQDLHSGSFGGGVQNPLNALAAMIGQLHDADNRVTVEGFYDDVRALTDEERKAIAALPFDEPGWLGSTGVPALWGEKGYTTLERIWTRPTLDVCGIIGGYTGEGAKTIIPSSARAKISCRLVPDQDPDEIIARLEAHMKKLAPPGIRFTFKALHGGKPFLAPTDHPAFDAAKRAFSRAFDRETVYIREGGSIPFVRTLYDELGRPCLLMGFGQPDENAHSPNEWLDLDNFHRGIHSAVYLLQELSRLKPEA